MKAQRAKAPAEQRKVAQPRQKPDQLLRSAIQFHQDGQLESAKTAYKKIIRLDPERSCYALNNLGLILNAEGNPSGARMLFARSAALHPNYADPLNNLGNLHRSQGALDAALVCFEKARVANPGNGGTYVNLGTLFEARGQNDLAIAAYREGIRLSPETRECHLNLGSILERTGHLEEAAACYEQALAVDPNYVEALNNLGSSWKLRGDFDKSFAYFEKALLADPAYGYTYLNLGFLFESRGKLDRAIAYYREGLRIVPDSPEAHLNLGGALQRIFQIEEAIGCYKRAIELKPNFSDAYSNLGIALKSEGRFAEALIALNQALKFEPNHFDTLMNLGNTLTALGRFDEAAASYERVLELRPDKATARSNLLLALNYPDTVSAWELARQSFRIAAWMDQDGLADRSPEPLRPARGRRLRVGYVSPDFRRHATNYFFESLLRSHNRSEVEIYCYAGVEVPDATTERFQSLADHWRSTVGVGDNELAAQIRADGINVLVDLAGHSGANRLPVFARRPAPVQMTWLGYPGTTGLKSIDYRIVDAITDPIGDADSLSSETLLRIEGGFLCYFPAAEAPEPAPPPFAANGFVTFGSFNNLTKLSDATLRVWGRLLAQVPTARLLLKSAHLGGESKTRIMERLNEHGIASERAILLPGGELTAEHLASYRHIDIALDPFPYNGTTTTCETLWMGVPTVALLGDSHRSRVGASLLTRVGCADLIARDQDDYIRIAAELAADPVRQQSLRRDLRPRMAASSLCDAPGFARKMEAAYRTAWRRWCQENDTVEEERSVRDDAVCLSLANGTSLFVPPSLDAITTYVVLEQGNWFEKEAGFVPLWLQPGMTAIDIGASLGVYCVPMARAVAPAGRVFAYEPAAETAALLARSRALNKVDNLVITRAALSDHTGRGNLFHAPSSESNRLGDDGPGETVEIVRLDDEDAQRDWGSPDFVKIDSVGADAAIVQGGKAFFTNRSPLVMFSVSNEHGGHLPACRALQALGYSVFRLLPGAPVLVPNESDLLDAYEQNLFAAKPDRAASMAGEGWLVQSLPEWKPDDRARGQALEPLRQLPFASAFAMLFAADLKLDPTYLDCLAAFAVWRSSGTDLPVRCAALDFAWRGLFALNQRDSTLARLLTLARVASEAGQRAVAVQALRHFMAVTKGSVIEVEEPFWPVSDRFASIVPEASVRDWLIGSVAEQIEISGHFSSLYTGATPELEWLSAKGFLSKDMERRRELLAARKAQHSDIPRRLRLAGQSFWLSAGLLTTDAAAPLADAV